MTFDATAFENSFMNSSVEGAMSTERPLPPIGQYQLRILDDVASDKEFRKIHVKAGTSTDQSTGAERPWMILNVPMEIIQRIDVPDTEFAERLVRWSSFLDIDESGKLLTGQDDNVDLGKLRAALGQNKGGEAWNPHMLGGQVLIGHITHRADKRDTSKKYPEVSSVAPLGQGNVGTPG